jgi:folate-binding protein YgfZ
MAADLARIQPLGLRETSGKTMLNDSVGTLSRAAVAQLGAIRVRGADAVKFLQGQLSNDVALLGADRPMLAGFHNPQGRVIALLWLIALGPDDILAVLPRELAAAVTARLAKYVLRAKVKVTDASADSEAAAQLVSVYSPVAERIAGGMPQVYAATSEQFVAQMLNLDVLGAISFTKGCYTGQEVVARAHYRGRVKRRMQRFRTHGSVALVAGASGKLRDGRSFKVVEAVTLDDGRCEFLAVAPLGHGEEGVTDAEAAAPSSDAVSIDAEQLTLPYELPA